MLSRKNIRSEFIKNIVSVAKPFLGDYNEYA